MAIVIHGSAIVSGTIAVSGGRIARSVRARPSGLLPGAGEMAAASRLASTAA
jgi:hypothetical protein